jgi:macrolide transport system ATP-binding/permease protein
MVHYFRALVARLRQLFGDRRADRELDDEIQTHLHMLTVRYVCQGMTEAEAARAARRQFGNVTLLQELNREMRGIRPIETLLQDVRYGLRILRKNPVVTAAAVLTLALGIGANLTIFSFVDAFFLRPIPAREPERLVNPEGGPNSLRHGYYAYPSYVHYRDHSKSFEALAAHYSTAPLNLMIGGDARVANGAVVSANYFSMLGIQPHMGRFFLPEEDAVPDRNPVVVISYRMWQDRFNGDPAVLGKELLLNGVACQIVGVAPADFPGVLAGFPNNFWLPTMMLRLGYRHCDAITDSGCRTLELLGRLAPGRTLAEAEAELNMLARQLAAAFPAEQGRVISLRPALGVRVNEREGYAYQMRLLMAVTGLLLVIACANVASLLLAHAAARRKEIAIRLSIGAGRFRLIRQFLTESLLLALAGGALGLLLSRWAKELLAGFYTTSYGNLQLYYDLSLSPRALVYALALTLFAGLLFGLLPAFQGTRHGLTHALKDEGGAQGPRRLRLRSGLVIGQVALSMALLIAASLLIRSESHVRQGANFDPQHVAALRVRPGLLNYSPEQAQTFTREVMRRLEATPGVQSVSLGSGSGLAWQGAGELRVRLPEQAPQRAEDQLQVEYKEVAPRFCETLKIPLLQGREFDERDRSGAPRVVVINETLARRLWPQGAALGRALILNEQQYQVVGVSLDAQLRNALEGPRAFLYLPTWQKDFRQPIDARLIVRLAGDPQTMLPQLRLVVAAVDPNVPLSEDVPLTQQVNAVYKPVLLTSAVLTWAGGLALFLSMLGLYGVLAFAVAERTREIGIRMALGAERRDVLRIVIAQGLRLALAGVVIGLPAAYAATQLMKALLYGVSATDPLMFALIALLLMVVASLACWIPARRATKVDPLVALRRD